MSAAGAAGAACPWCEGLAYSGRHEAYLADDDRERVRFWRCRVCGTLWCDGEQRRVPIAEDRADALVPGWRERAAAIVTDGLDVLLDRWRAGAVEPGDVDLALLHHVVWRSPARPDRWFTRPDVLAAGSDDAAAALERVWPGVALADVGDVGFVLDPGSAQPFVVGPERAWQLGLDARSTAAPDDEEGR